MIYQAFPAGKKAAFRVICDAFKLASWGPGVYIPCSWRYRPDGEIGRRKGLKIPRPLDVPVRPRLGAPHIDQGLTGHFAQ